MPLLHKNYRRIILKIGSSLLVSQDQEKSNNLNLHHPLKVENIKIQQQKRDDQIRVQWLEIFTNDVAKLINLGKEIIITTSGAVALGREILGFKNKKLSLHEKQAAAAAGQIELMSLYQKFFKTHGLKVAQILLTASDCNSRQRYLNCKNTIETLLKHRVIPIINENDSVAVDEIKIGDNDRLASRVAQMISADLLVLFSDIDGLFDKNPKLHPDAVFISEVPKITREIEKMAGGSNSIIGTGGMITKIIAAKMASQSGCQTVITNGFENGAVESLFFAEKKFTIFLSDQYSKKPEQKISEQNFGHLHKARKNWLAGILNAKGEIIINENAAIALRQKASLLPIGAVAVKGIFEKGEMVIVLDEQGNQIARGLCNHNSDEMKKILQKNSGEVKKILGKTTKIELIHVDNMVLC